MSTIRASEIGTYLFCKRAWWYQKQGYESNNTSELAAGTRVHVQHTRLVMVSGCLRILAYIVLITAILILAVYVTGKII
jgi:CRISPR/Cas system-associated exonuclease Cas4 (RecB family)